MLEEASKFFKQSFRVDFDFSFSVIVGLLVFIRILTAINLTSYLGGKPVPANIKVAFSMALTIFVTFFLAPTLDVKKLPESHVLLGILILKEVFFGFLMGFLNTIIFQGIQSAGSMIDNQRSVANARIFNPALGAQTSIFGSYLFQLSITLFITLGGHRLFLSALIESFQVVSPIEIPQLAPGFTPLLSFLVKLTAQTLIICLQLTAPILIAIFVADLILGIMNRIAPMINVFELGFNIKGMVGVILIYFALPVILYQTKYWFQVLVVSFKKLGVLFRGG